MKICISGESTCDLSKELMKEFDIHVIPYTVTLGDKSGIDGEITPKEIMDYVDKTGVLPKTSAINQYGFEQYFKSLLDLGYDYVIHFTLSSKMSSTYQNACIASQAFEGKVRVIDTQNLSSAIALQLIYARRLANTNKYTIDEIVNKVEARVPYAQASFVLWRLDYLFKGGRCSALTNIAAKVLGIRPQIIVDNGAMRPNKKYRGKDNIVVKKYGEDTLAEFNNYDKDICFVTATNYSQEIYDILVNLAKEKGFKKIYCMTAGATITSHCGDKTIGILYYNDGDHSKDFE